MKVSWKKYLISSVVEVILSVFVWWLAYGFEFRLDLISNSMFAVGICVLAVALIVHTGATRATLGVSYTSRTLFQPQKMKEKYTTFQDYYDEKAPGHRRNVGYLLIVSGVVIAISMILAVIYLSTIVQN